MPYWSNLFALYHPNQMCFGLQAHVLLHFINASHANLNARKRMNSNRSYQNANPLNMDFIPHIAESCKIVTSSYGVFKKKAREQVKPHHLYHLHFVPGLG